MSSSSCSLGSENDESSRERFFIPMLDMHAFTKDVSLILLGYGIGCFSTGYYLVRLWKSEDIRTLGSGSAGAHNVGRVLGKKGLVLTFLGDAAKGALSIALARLFGVSTPVLALVFLAMILGHIWPAQLGFRGGKGLAPSFGAGLLFDFRLTIIVAFLSLILGTVSRQFTLSLMVVIAVTPFLLAWKGYDMQSALEFGVLVSILLFASRENIAAALRGIYTSGAHRQ